jgi:hypothetical protein
MGNVIFYLLGFAAILAIYAMLRGALKAYFFYRGKRVVRCPETLRTVAVEVDAAHAAVTNESGSLDLRLKSCTRWPERENCGQECVQQIKDAPEDCLVSNMLSGWYEGKSCALCARKFHRVEWFDHHPGLRDREGSILSWGDIRPESVPEKLASSTPVCWNCYIAENFRRENPDLVTDRNFQR